MGKRVSEVVSFVEDERVGGFCSLNWVRAIFGCGNSFDAYRAFLIRLGGMGGIGS